ncbi:MAG: 30S ribosome-binding factor RbfA [Pseudomonadota bacterium]
MSRQPKTREGQPRSQRQLRVGELVRHAISDLLNRGVIHDPVLETRVVTVPEVRMSPDLKNATVFIVPLGGDSIEDVLSALRHHVRFIRGEVAKAVQLRNAPHLTFQADTSFDEADKISELLARPEVRRDLD